MKEAESSKRPIAIIVHGGAKEIPEEEQEAHREGCRRAAAAGYEVLARGGSAVEAVETAIRALEDDPTFNAGTGSELNAEGNAQCDAGLMEGSKLNAGGVAGVTGIRHPISVARRLLDEETVLLVADGAVKYAEENVPEERCDPEELVTPARKRDWEKRQAQAEDAPAKANNTVGAVARDAEGNMAAGASTGGTGENPRGRVGDTPLPGSGFFCDDRVGGCAMTGDGEHIMRVGVARSVIERLEVGAPPSVAAKEPIEKMTERVGGEAGAIVLDAEGRLGWDYNSAHMAVGYATPEEPTGRGFVRKEEAGATIHGA